MSDKLSDELKSFAPLWGGGFYEGDPLAPLSRSTYGPLNYMSVLHATYLRCIKPYVNGETIALELGPGRGAWTKALLPSMEVWALDALSAEHNCFFEYLGHPKNVQYFQVSDFSCSMLPDDHFTYMFSFGCLCHVSFQGITEYATNLRRKLKSGADCFWYVADYEKWNRTVHHRDAFSIWRHLAPRRAKYVVLDYLLRLIDKFESKINNPELRLPDVSDDPSPGRWYDAGTERTCDMLRSLGYKIVDSDVGTLYRDPIIHFRKE